MNSTLTNTSTPPRRLRSGKFAARTVVASLAVAGSLAAVAPTANALPVPPPGVGSTSLDYQCYSIQEQVHGLVAQFADATTDAQADLIRSQLSNLGSQWNAVGCRAMYGNIDRSPTTPPKNPHRNTSGPVPQVAGNGAL